MMLQKNNGFTIAEVLLSMFILTVCMYELAQLQSRSITKVKKSSEEIQRVFYVKKYLYQLYLKPPTKDKPRKDEIEEPALKIVAQKTEINRKKSSLKDLADDLDVISSEGSWKIGAQNQTMKMISFVQKPKQTQTNE